jgi:hypothetical protein
MLQARETEEESPSALLAFVALDEFRVPKEANVRDALQKYFPKETSIENIEIDQKSITFSMNDTMVMVAEMPFPIPWDDLEGPCESSLLWPEATKVMKSHRSHVLVTMFQGEGSFVEQCVVFTKILAATTEILPSIGVYWGHGNVVSEPAYFCESAREATAKVPPVLLWIGMFPRRNPDNSITLITTGLDYFNCMDIEVVHSKMPLRELLGMATGAAHLMLVGDVFKDGDTIGGEGRLEERIKTRHSKSIAGRDETVLRIEF